MRKLTVKDLAEAFGGVVHGPDNTLITGVATIADATSGDVVLAESATYLSAAAQSEAAAVICAADSCGDKCVIQVSDPRRAFLETLLQFAPEHSQPTPGVDPGARLGERVTLGEGVSVGFGAFISDDTVIGDRAVIYPLAYVGEGASIGSGSVLHPNATVYAGCIIGNRVIIHAGAVVGSDGFGYQQVDGRTAKIPHIGTVVIADDVEIGANTTIDRAKTGRTVIGEGTKIDNLVHIAHNVQIGKSCLIAAEVGIAGSCEIGNGVIMAGMAGVADHISIGDGATVSAHTGVIEDVAPNEIVSGYYAKPHKHALRIESAYRRLPEMRKTLENLEKEVERLSRGLAQLGGDKKTVEFE